MDNLKTVEGVRDPLYAKQVEDVAKMRTSLLSCNDDAALTKTALQNIAVLRVYHQIARIIKYTELMDKLEDKLYESIDSALDRMDIENTNTIAMLLDIQGRLQKTMIESHKLLQPFLELQDQSFLEFTTSQEVSPNPNTLSLNANAREKIRISAQAVLQELNAG